ncbi:hypothetical protein XENORESO_006236, partial [Xenotaenia resolanae]
YPFDWPWLQQSVPFVSVVGLEAGPGGRTWRGGRMIICMTPPAVSKFVGELLNDIQHICGCVQII